MKCDFSVFEDYRKKNEEHQHKQDIFLDEINDHCNILDNYLEKYLPIRTQALINETLRSVLSGKERRRLELYDSDKISILY